jgi:hypothetical protein
MGNAAMSVITCTHTAITKNFWNDISADISGDNQ